MKMLHLVCCTLLFAVSISSSSASSRRATADYASQVYSLYQQVHTQPISTAESPSDDEISFKANLPNDQTTVIPDYDWYPKGRSCPLFDEKNMQEAMYVFQLMIAPSDFEVFAELCDNFRRVLNEDIYYFAYTGALISREDTRGILIPPLEEISPYSFLPGPVVQAAKDCTQNTTGPNYVDYQYENSTELCTAYFREDLLVNSFRWVWHLVYAVTLALGPAKDRQGELFCFAHQQILARYDAERLTCGLPKVVPFPGVFSPIKESYYPTLLSSLSGKFYPGRPPNLVLQDVPDIGIVISDLDAYYKRLINASTTRTYQLPDGTYTALPSISVLGAMTEASNATPNRDYYGNFHNFMHRAFSRVTNANVTGADPGIMGFITSAMRDPLFYSWHRMVDNIFNIYLAKNPKYDANDLKLADIVIRSAYVRGNGDKNSLETFNQQRFVNISEGVDFSGTNPALIRVKHLQHENFTHYIVIENKAKQTKLVTIRIFLAPKTNHLNNIIPFPEQRRMYFTLDIFTASVEPGVQTITRKSQDSSVTIPTQLGFEQLQFQVTREGNANNSGEIPTRCLCGWPDTHLIPRGTPGGSTYNYFVMASDGADYTEPTSQYCTSAPVYCGMWNASYPDSKPMGYPFDREAESSIQTIANFASYPNMYGATEIVIKHSANKLVDEQGAVISS